MDINSMKSSSTILYPSTGGIHESTQWNSNPSPLPGGKLERFIKEFWALWIVSTFIVVADIFIDLFRKWPKIDTNRRCSGQVCVMTGGARGIGFEVVKKLLQLDYTLILGVRNIDSMQNGIDEIRNSGITSGQVKLYYLDLKSFRSVRNFANDVLMDSEASRIDLLINNAGIYQDRYEVTEDNIEAHFQVNYLSHFLLTNLLLPRIKDTAEVKKEGSCHIINTTSVLHGGGSIQFDNLYQKKLFIPVRCYSDAKLCQIMHSMDVQSQLQQEGMHNIQMYSVHPGSIQTGIWTDLGVKDWLISPWMKLFCRTTEEGANAILYPALTPDTSNVCGGNYYVSGLAKAPNRQAEDPQIRKQLRDLSSNLVTTDYSVA